MEWFHGANGVPFGNPNYDSGLGGSHDLTVLAVPNTPVTALLEGTVSDISYPSWGAQLCVELTTPYNGHRFFCEGLHLAAINPALSKGAHLSAGDLVGWSGGCNTDAQYAGTSNPTGKNMLNTPFMSSQPQVGIALHDGPAYGGAGWRVFPPIDWSLDPTPILTAARQMHPNPGILEQAKNIYEATREMLVACYQGVARTDTGIAALWFRAYTDPNPAKRVNAGPPTTLEFPFKDWSGRPGVCVFFQNGMRIEFVNGVAIMYDAYNRAVYK